MVRNSLAVITGFIAGIIVMVLIGVLGYKIYGPDGPLIDYNDKALMQHFMLYDLPFSALILMCFAIFLGSIAGGFVASQIHFESGETTSLIVGGLLLTSVVVYMMKIPHPPWFWLVCGITCVPLSYLGYFIDSTYLGRDVPE